MTDQTPSPYADKVAATITLEHLARRIPALNALEWDSPATVAQLRAALEVMGNEVHRLQAELGQRNAVVEVAQRAAEAMTELQLLAMPQRYVLPPPTDESLQAMRDQLAGGQGPLWQVPEPDLQRPAGTKPPKPGLRLDLCGGTDTPHAEHLGGNGEWNCPGAPRSIT